MRITLLFSFLVCVIPTAAFGQDCMNTSVQSELNVCAQTRYELADKILNETFAAIKKRVGGDSGVMKKIVVAQRAWITFRDAECEVAAAGVSGGSAEPLVRANCLSEMTQERNSKLLRLVNCEEGDLSCPTD